LGRISHFSYLSSPDPALRFRDVEDPYRPLQNPSRVTQWVRERERESRAPRVPHPPCPSQSTLPPPHGAAPGEGVTSLAPLEDQWRTYQDLQYYLQYPALLQSQSLFQLTSDQQNHLVSKYWRFTDKLGRHLMGTKLSSKEKSGLALFAQEGTGGLTLTACEVCLV
jgi:hypothetical protein